ncbi:hypothetical protein ACVWZK_006478 [Bradyrhizobium sp. GM0.4]|jgi:hypothetical protein
MQQRQLNKGTPAANGKKGATPTTAAAPVATPPADTGTATTSSENKPIRSVGPSFLPQQQK